jgi:hypothetical protein
VGFDIDFDQNRSVVQESDAWYKIEGKDPLNRQQMHAQTLQNVQRNKLQKECKNVGKSN